MSDVNLLIYGMESIFTNKNGAQRAYQAAEIIASVNGVNRRYLLYFVDLVLDFMAHSTELI